MKHSFLFCLIFVATHFSTHIFCCACGSPKNADKAFFEIEKPLIKTKNTEKKENNQTDSSAEKKEADQP
jgi:hypothetical protein